MIRTRKITLKYDLHVFHREEKSLRHVAMVAIFLDHNKTKIRTVSNFSDLIQFHLICQMFGKFSGFNPKGPYESLEKKKNFLCCVHLLLKPGA